MSDLISRKEIRERLFNEMIKAEVNSPVYLTLECAIEDIDNQLTAYDVDKVIKELKGTSGIQFDGENESYELNWCISTHRAIDIVKRGGKDE